MKNGIVPIYEPNLEEMFLRNIQAERLFFTTNLKEALEKVKLFILLYQLLPEDGSADLSYVLQVANDIGEMMTEYKVL
jgi:UDPglucose 6-dehydrogenase